MTKTTSPNNDLSKFTNWADAIKLNIVENALYDISLFPIKIK